MKVLVNKMPRIGSKLGDIEKIAEVTVQVLDEKWVLRDMRGIAKVKLKEVTYQ